MSSYLGEKAIELGVQFATNHLMSSLGSRSSSTLESGSPRKYRRDDDMSSHISALLTNGAESMSVAAEQSSANKSNELNEHTNTPSTRVSYNIPGYDGHQVIAAGKRCPDLKLNLGKSLYFDNTPDFTKIMNRKAKVSFEFTMQLNADAGKRCHHYQSFRHKWSRDVTYNNGLGTGGVDYYPNNTPLLMPNTQVPALAFLPVGLSSNSTTHIPQVQNGLTMMSLLSLNDLYDQSYALMNPALPIINQGLNYTTTDQEAVILKPSQFWDKEKHRMSYPEFWNRGSQLDILSDLPNRTAPYQIHPVINSGTINYAFTNKGQYGSRIEIVVYRIKKDNNLPTVAAEYNMDGGGLDVVQRPRVLMEQEIRRAYVLHGRGRQALDTMNGTGREEEDVDTNPKVKFMPQLSGMVNSRSPLTEVERSAFVLGAGYKRNFTLKLPGIKTNPATQQKNMNPKVNTGGFSYITQQAPFDQHCYFVCISHHGLLSTEAVATDITVAPEARNITPIGNTFSPSSIFVEGKYTENVQAAAVKIEEFGTVAYNLGRSQPSSTIAQYTKLPITIVPQNNMVLSTQSQTYVPSDPN